MILSCRVNWSIVISHQTQAMYLVFVILLLFDHTEAVVINPTLLISELGMRSCLFHNFPAEGEEHFLYTAV